MKTCKTRRFAIACLCVAALIPAVAIVSPSPAHGADSASAIEFLETTKFANGLIVHLHCGDGRWTPSLRVNDATVVHGLAVDAANVAAAREHIRQAGCYGPVSIEQFDGRRLPYADNLVNRIVASEGLGDVAMDEVLRVLAPGGMLCIREVDAWRSITKPTPEDTDEWTHYLHDATGNPVANDDRIGPPRRLQWSAAPSYTRSHEHIPSMYSLVSTGGRLFYIADEAPVESIRETPVWRLVARDAFNGTILWKRDVSEWFPHIVNWGQTPKQLQRMLVAIDDRVYVALGTHAPVSVLDAATGETIRTFEGTRGAEEIVVGDGIALVAVREVTPDRVEEMSRFAPLLRKPDSPLYDRDSADPLVREFKSTENKAPVTIKAIDVASGETLWSRSGKDVSGLRTCTLSLVGGRALYQSGSAVHCLDARTGEPIWRKDAPTVRVVSDKGVFCFGGEKVVGMDIDSGEQLWSHPASLLSALDMFVIDDSLWIGGFQPFNDGNPRHSAAWGPYFVVQRDLKTGEIGMRIEQENPGHHHRCYSNKATGRFILGGRRGTEFIDLQEGEVLWNSWARGVCKYGVLPCNGLLYTPPHACGCYSTAKTIGFNAMAAADPDANRGVGSSPVVERGRAFEASSNATIDAGDWPTLRHDAGRGGAASCFVSPSLKMQWKSNVGGALTAPTVAGGKVFLASKDEHAVVALDSDTGAETWRFTADARIDSPPTIVDGRAILGCRDGCVYSLNTESGDLAWRLDPLQDDRLAMVRGQLESATPSIGAVLSHEGAVYCSAGQSSYLDGGIRLYRLDPTSGKVMDTCVIYSPDPETDRQPKQYDSNRMPGSREDVLSADASRVYLRDVAFDNRLRTVEDAEPHLFTVTSFLDGAWAHRAYWIFGTQCSLSTGCSGQAKGLVYGRLIVFDEDAVCGHGRASVHWSNQLLDGDYRLFAKSRDGSQTRWEKRLPIQVRAMVLAGDVIFAAGPTATPNSALWELSERRPSLLLAISTADGSELARYELDDTPTFDGMAAARGKLFLTMEDGAVACFGE